MSDQNARPLTPAGRALFQALHELYLEAGEPSCRDLARRFGPGDISYNTVNQILRGYNTLPTSHTLVPAEVASWQSFDFDIAERDALVGCIEDTVRALADILTRREDERPAGDPDGVSSHQRADLRRWLVGLLVELAARRGGAIASPAPPLDTITTPRPPRAPLNCSIFCTDVAGFGDPRRDDDDRRVVREALYRILWEAFEASNVPWALCRHEDRGDGTLTVVPPTVSTVSLVEPLIAQLAAKLKRHNRQAGDPVRIQLRVALNVGPVLPDAAGLGGYALIQTARILDAPVLKDALAATGADLGFIASAHVYDTVIRHTVGLVDPTAYRRVRVSVKESTITSWMYLAGAG
jgi:hypothetical protein